MSVLLAATSTLPGLLLLLLLELHGLEGLQQLLFLQLVSEVPRREALQQLQHPHDPRHQPQDALLPVAVDEPLHLGADQLGDLVHVVQRQRRAGPVEAALRGAGVPLGFALGFVRLHVFLVVLYRKRRRRLVSAACRFTLNESR